MKGEFEFT